MSLSRMRVVTGCVVALVAGGAAALPAAAAGGSLDPSWNGSGFTTTSFGGAYAFADGIVVQGGRNVTVVGGSSGVTNVFAVARYEPNGVLDPSFGVGGLVTTSFNGDDLADAVTYQGDKTVVVGYTSPDGGTTFNFALARYLANGALDPTFGSGGKVVTSFGGGYDFADAVLVHGDKIVVAGESRTGAGYNQFIVARYNTDGSLDTSFGTGGFTTTDFGFHYNAANGVAMMGDRIVAAGYAQGPTHLDFAVARYTSSGALDTSFGSGGKVLTDFGNDAAGHAVDVRGYSIVVVGAASNGTDNDFAAAEYNANGSPLTGFGSGGKTTLNIGADDHAYGGGFTPDGSVYAAGDTGSAVTDSFAVARWTTTGAPDPLFGTGGFTVTSIGVMSGAFAAGIGPDGKVVAAGFSDNDFAVARYLGH